MTENGLKTMKDFAAEIGVSRVTVSDLVDALGITPKAMTNGRAKGLDAQDQRKIRRALQLGNRPAAASA